MSAPEPLYEPWITMQPANLFTGHDWVEHRDAAWEDREGRMPSHPDYESPSERTTTA